MSIAVSAARAVQGVLAHEKQAAAKGRGALDRQRGLQGLQAAREECPAQWTAVVLHPGWDR